MSVYLQADRLLEITTPLDQDVLLLIGFRGREAFSELFRFDLDLIAQTENEAEKVVFEQLLGKPIAVTIREPFRTRRLRHFHGICRRIAQGHRDQEFTHYQMEVVPSLWILTRRTNSRIFQGKSALEIIEAILDEHGIKYKNQLCVEYNPHNYCVQYRESDFDFLNRLMEEEGISYYFEHEEGGHTLVLIDDRSRYASVPFEGKARFDEVEGEQRDDARVTAWEKAQELRASKVLLWDHHFQLPHKPLDADKPTDGSVRSGTVDHALKLPTNKTMELYDYPGHYAERFDGIDKGGGERASDLQGISKENVRLAQVRMEEEQVHGLTIRGRSDCVWMTEGATFDLVDHFDADGSYVLTEVNHNAELRDYRSGDGGPSLVYDNTFGCIPASVTFRPARQTPRPVVQGTQTAVVVGPKGEEIFTDKYGRIKVQFHWDREGSHDAGSSCWIRVGTIWAGRQWGAIHIPRIGQEVIVAFEEGNADMPIVVGSVYNADMMPPYALPENKTQSGVKSRSTLKGDSNTFNELRFEDKKGGEQVYFHAEKDFDRVVENNDTLKVGFEKKDKGDQTIEIFNNQTLTVGTSKADEGSRTTTIYKDDTLTVETGDRTVKVEKGDDTHTVSKGKRTATIQGNETLSVKQGNRSTTLDKGNDSLELKMGNQTTTLKMGNQTTKLNLGKSSTQAMQGIELKVGQSSIKIDQTGVTIKGMMIKVEGTIQTQVKGMITQVDGSAMLQAKGGITMIN